MGKFKVGDKVRILDAKNIAGAGFDGYENGDILVLIEHLSQLALPGKLTPTPLVLKHSELKYIELVEPFKDQYIESLEKRVEELEKLVGDYFKLPVEPSTDDVAVIEFEGNKYRKVDRKAREGDVVIFKKDSIYSYFESDKPYKVKAINGEPIFLGNHNDWLCVYYNRRTIETTDVYELIPSFTTYEGQDLESEYAEQVKAEKTPNQLRAEIIEKAKWFVEEHYQWRNNGHIKAYLRDGKLYQVEFIINENERAVVALLRWGTLKGAVDYRGIAKCNPSDVFNKWIGMAIALGRALGLDVSEFEGAVQPTEVVNGHIVKGKIKGRVIKVTSIKDNGEFKSSDLKPWEYSLLSYVDKIINDTNAIYGEVE